MTGAKPIKCPDCADNNLQVTMLEIRSHGYPKGIFEPNQKRVFNEYRYVCPNCGSEWIYDTLLRLYLEVPKDAEFHFDKYGKQL